MQTDITATPQADGHAEPTTMAVPVETPMASDPLAARIATIEEKVDALFAIVNTIENVVRMFFPRAFK